MIIIQEKDKITFEQAENIYKIKIPKNKYSSLWKFPIGRENMPTDKKDNIVGNEFVQLYLGNYESIYGRKTQNKKKKAV